jgi:hypothetical protein
MLVAWTSAMRCLNVVPSTSSSTSRYRKVPSTVGQIRVFEQRAENEFTGKESAIRWHAYAVSGTRTNPVLRPTP